MNTTHHRHTSFLPRFAARATRRVLIAAAIWPCLTASLRAELPPGFEMVLITDDFDRDGGGRMNDCGQIVYSKQINQDWDLEEIFLYDNGRTTRLTFNTVHDWLPVINNASTIIWWHRISEENTFVWMHRDRETDELFRAISGGDMNDLGHIAFTRFGDVDCQGETIELFLYDGETIIQVSDEDGDDHQVQSINNSDDIAWTRFDFCESPWESDVMAHIGGQHVQITSDRFQPQRTWINNEGIIAWETLVNDGECAHIIELWVDGTIQRFPGCGRAPRINDRGDMAFSRQLPQGRITSVFYQSEQAEYPLPYEGAIATGAQDINNWGEVSLFINFGLPHTDRAILRRIRTGDSEFDGDIDHDDLAKLVDCMTGPMWVERTNPGPEDTLCECRFLDINHDGSVDLRDYAIFQENYGKKP